MEKWQATIQQDFPVTFHKLNSVDCQVMNHHHYPVDIASAVKVSKDENMSLVVIVDGHVRLHQRGRGPVKQFSETFVLVRNRDGRSLISGKRKWLVQSQSCRHVASYIPPANSVMDEKGMEIN